MKRKASSYAGIPSDKRERVRSIVHLYAGQGEKISPQQAYQKVVSWDKEQATKKQREEEEREKTILEGRKSAVESALRKMAYVRDFLDGNSDPQEMALFGKALLCEAGRTMEQTLFDLGLTEGMDGLNDRREGWFVEFLN